MDLVAGRWSGSIPVFGLEISPPPGPADVGASRFELVESFPARWLAGVSMEWLVGEAWLATHEHLFILNQRSIEAPVRTDLVRASLADPAAIQALFGMLAPREDLFLSPMPASSHQIAVTRSAGRWTAAAGMRMDLLHGDMERRFQRPRFTTVDASVNWRAFRDRLRLDIDATCHLSPADIWVHPSVTWEASDAGIWTAGAQLFGGDDPRDPLHAHLSYHRLRGDGFVYLRFTRHLI
jgi:hypothetical protein